MSCAMAEPDDNATAAATRTADNPEILDMK